jgi:hypothetical protein
MLLAGWLMMVLRGLVPVAMADHLPFLRIVGLNGHTAFFMGAMSLLATVMLTGISTVRFSLRDLHDGLSEGGRGSGQLWRKLGGKLVAAELAVAVVLLGGAGLLGKSLYRLLRVDIGFNSEHLAAVNVMAPGSSYQKPEQLNALYDEIEGSVRQIPGVESVGFTDVLPVGCYCDTTGSAFRENPTTASTTT